MSQGNATYKYTFYCTPSEAEDVLFTKASESFIWRGRKIEVSGVSRAGARRLKGLATDALPEENFTKLPQDRRIPCYRFILFTSVPLDTRHVVARTSSIVFNWEAIRKTDPHASVRLQPLDDFPIPLASPRYQFVKDAQKSLKALSFDDRHMIVNFEKAMKALFQQHRNSFSVVIAMGKTLLEMKSLEKAYLWLVRVLRILKYACFGVALDLMLKTSLYFYKWYTAYTLALPPTLSLHAEETLETLPLKLALESLTRHAMDILQFDPGATLNTYLFASLAFISLGFFSYPLARTLLLCCPNKHQVAQAPRKQAALLDPKK